MSFVYKCYELIKSIDGEVLQSELTRRNFNVITKLKLFEQMLFQTGEKQCHV